MPPPIVGVLKDIANKVWQVTDNDDKDKTFLFNGVVIPNVLKQKKNFRIISYDVSWERTFRNPPCQQAWPPASQPGRLWLSDAGYNPAKTHAKITKTNNKHKTHVPGISRVLFSLWPFVFYFNRNIYFFFWPIAYRLCKWHFAYVYEDYIYIILLLCFRQAALVPFPIQEPSPFPLFTQSKPPIYLRDATTKK